MSPPLHAGCMSSLEINQMSTQYQFNRILSEHPWIANFANKKDICQIEVNRLDKSVLVCNYGRSGYDGATYIRYYLVNKDGSLLNEVGFRKPKTFFEKLFPSILCTFWETVLDGILRTVEEFPEEEIVYVLNLHGPASVTLYKITKGHTMTTFINTVKEEISENLKK